MKTILSLSSRGKNTIKLLKSSFKHRGQGMVEFALVLPLLLLVVFGIIEFGRLLFYYSAITTASREAARYGSAAENYQNCDEIRSAAIRIGSFVGITNSATDISIQYDHPYITSTVSRGNCPVAGLGPSLKLGDRIVVTVQKQFKPIVPLVNLPTFTIQSVSRRTLLKNLDIE